MPNTKPALPLLARRAALRAIVGLGCLVSAVSVMPNAGLAQSDKVQASMAALKAAAAGLGAPKVAGSDSVAGKTVPILYFGDTKINSSFDVVDKVVKDHGGTATLFVKADNDYVRVSTNVKKDDGSRAVGTVLDPNGPAIAKIKNGEPYYGDATILGKDYVTGYEPIRDQAGNVIGIYYVGYRKS